MDLVDPARDTASQNTESSVDPSIETVGRLGAVPSILEVVCQLTGLRFAAVARVTQDRWTACAVRDEIEFGLKPGGELPIGSTICNQIRDSGHAVVIDHASKDPDYCEHHTPKLYGFESYISMPIVRANGDFFGTLCALDPAPARLIGSSAVKTFQLFSQLIAAQLEAEEHLQQSQTALINEQQSAELRDQFIAVLGHDLRNPLSSVTVGAEILLKMPLDEEVHTIARRMLRSGDRMAKLIDDVLDFARGRLGGGLGIEPQKESALVQTLEHVVAELSSVYPTRRIDTRFDIGRPVSCDSERIAQLLSNLLSNALTHGAHDQPVTVTGRCIDEIFELSVSNHGPAIDADTANRLFRPFARRGARENREGLGLGLYIASQIAIAHRGTLAVSSTAERTRFTLSMPVSAGFTPP